MENIFRWLKRAEAREGNPVHYRPNCRGINTLTEGNRVERSAVLGGNEAQRGGQARARPLPAQQ